MQAQIKLGRIWGVQIGLHYSWLLVALLITLSLSAHFRATNPVWDPFIIYASAIVTALLFFAMIILHELSHAIVAKTRGLPVRAITLFALGGVAQIEREAEDAKTEFWMAIAGPITSILIGFTCLAMALALGWQPVATPSRPPLAVLVWLGYINLSLALFNMIPGFPLDGGRVLRSILWWVTGDGDRSTRMAARIGQLVAFGFIILGLFRFFAGAGFGGLWISFIGWFLLDAARSSYAQVQAMANLRGLYVGDVMTRDCPVVDGRSNLQTFADEYLLRTGRRCFMVRENDNIVGLITPREVKKIERARWPYTTVDDAMRPLSQFPRVDRETPVLEALDVMTRRGLHLLPVISEGHIEGILSLNHILQLLQARAELSL